MRLCSIKELDETMVLGKSIYHSNGKLLLGAGYRITPVIKDKLIERGYTHVYIMEEGSENVVPEDIISDEIRLQAKAKLADKMTEIKNQSQFKYVSRSKALKLIKEGYLKKVNITYDIRKVLEDVLNDISATASLFMNTVMIKSTDNYFLDHALNVTVLSILIGKKYRFDHNELMSLALGAYLHDIGKVIIENIKDSDKPGKADELYKEHPTFGYLLLHHSSNVSPMETQIVNQHHEYQNGSGFPIGLKGENMPPIKRMVRETKGQIFRMAEICCVADAFDNLAYNPLDKEQKSPDQAIKQIIMDSGTLYNSDVLQTMLKVVPFYPVGAYIKVIDIVDPSLVGSRGVVAKINENNINKPVIIITKNRFLKKIPPVIIDTSKFTHVELQLIV